MMDGQPLVSVIVPVYNVENYIDECIKSIVNQTYKNLEIWLVDDGSTDMSGVCCKKWAGKDERIKLICQSNQGLSAARNAALEKCIGKWIVFIDGDDVADPEYIEELFCLAKKYHTPMAQCENADVPVEKNPPYIREEGIMDSRGFLLSNKFRTMAWGKIYARELFENVRYPYGKIHEDVALTYRLVYHAGKIAYTNRVLYYCNQRPDSINAKGRFYKEKLVILEFYKQQIEFYENKNEVELVKKSYRDYAYALLGNYDKTKRILKDQEIADKIKKKYRKICLQAVKSDNAISFPTKIVLLLCYIRPEFWRLIMESRENAD